MADFSRRETLAVLAAAATPMPALADEPIHVRSVGDGAVTWVLLHPFSASGRFWEARAAAMAAEHGVRVLSPDLPSHGRSRIVQRFDYVSATDAIERALASHRDGVALVVGASSGGLVALKLAARWGKPVAAIGVGLSFSAANVAEMSASAQALPEGALPFINAFLEQGDRQRSAIQRHFGDLAALGEAPLVSAEEAVALANRTLIINGASDAFFSRDSAHALADAIPSSLLTFVTGAGHLDPLGAAHRDYTWASIAAFARTRA